MAIITLEEYKALAGLTANDLDDKIATCIPVVEEAYLARRNRPLETEGVFPDGAKWIAKRMIDWLLYNKRDEGERSVSLGAGVSVEYDDLILGFPADIMRDIRRYARVVE